MRFLRKVRYFLKKQQKHLHRSGDRWAQFVADVLYDRRRTRGARIFAAFLVPLSFLFFGIVQLRQWLYRKRLLRAQALGCHVIVVGNITMGGTGKTPVAEYLARLLLSMGRRPAIISRGYKSKGEPFYQKFWRWMTHAPERPPKIVSDGRQILMDSEHAGDEPYMLAKNLQGVPVIVDKDRVKAGRCAIKRFHADVLILDDGYQYFRIASTLRIVLVDCSNPFGNYYLLPRGILREPLCNLNRASLLLLTKSEGVVDPLLEQNLRYGNPTAPIAECRHQSCYFVSQNGATILPLEAISGKKVALFCAIASPSGFEQFIISLGAKVIYKKRYLDHHRFSGAELSSIDEHALNADYLITTEKDVVRIPQNYPFHAPLYYTRVDIQFLRNEQALKTLLTTTLNKKAESSTLGPYE